MKKAIALLVLIGLCLFSYVRAAAPDQDPYLVTDYSRLHPVKVERVVSGKEEAQLVELINEANERGLTVSIAGQRHSQGGHTYYKDGIVVDMTSFNRILSIDAERRTVTAQAGATWEDIQNAVNPLGLSVKTMQSQNTFTIGGSISVNAHGRDTRNGSMIGSVESFRLLLADGTIMPVSRTENAELFPLALGGYGLFGIILDVTLSLTEDEVYETETVTMKTEEYAAYFRQEVLASPDVRMHIARISVAPDGGMGDMFAKSYKLAADEELSDYNRLTKSEPWTTGGKLLFQLNRKTDFGKSLLWKLQTAFFTEESGELISRNNAMRAAWKFMSYSEPGSNDLLQEYFIPIDQFGSFVKAFDTIVKQRDMNLLNVTVRYVKHDEEAVLSYAKEDMFALVCLFHAGLNKQEQAEMRESVQSIIDEVIAHEGSYYLPYADYPSVQQFQSVYPRHEAFFAAKRKYDPQELFGNYFYAKYGAQLDEEGEQS
ncbi:FAD-dependent oxidoreductase [Paenibacillus sp. NPDC058071]|uniref:FAD-binding oxidoreductase n=1 Tax=Paenibacillus sp. NPDC058071 TaxID=3346326 RepID=UPI0036DA1B25